MEIPGFFFKFQVTSMFGVPCIYLALSKYIDEL